MASGEITMSKPHFYRTCSRLGMINLPNKGKAFNIGVEDGPEAVLDADFLSTYPGAAVDDFKFSLPEDIHKASYGQVLAAESNQLAELLNKTLKAGETQVVVGGDHSIAFASLLAVLRRHKAADVGYMQFDSHGDVHLFKTSPSGNFHGMWLRPFLSEFDHASIEGMVGRRLKPGQLMFVGNLELEPEEERVFEDFDIANVTSQTMAQDRAGQLKLVQAFVDRFPHLHISFDIDVFDRAIAGATGTPAENGFQPEDIFAIIAILAKKFSKSIDLIEVNPKKPNPESTIAIAQRVLKGLLPVNA